jgi:hypothetical protein
MEARYSMEQLTTAHYKNYPIYVSATYRHGGGWDALGIVLDPDPKVTREIKRLTNVDMIFLEDQQEAENLARILCEAWIDGLDT